MSNPPNLLDELRNALIGGSPGRNALADGRPPSGNAMVANALTRPYLEPEVPESMRAAAAWSNAGGGPDTVWLYDQDGRLIHRADHGKNSEHGWHVHRMHDGALGGRYTWTNIVARHWLGNTSDGGTLGAFLRDRYGR